MNIEKVNVVTFILNRILRVHKLSFYYDTSKLTTTQNEDACDVKIEVLNDSLEVVNRVMLRLK